MRERPLRSRLLILFALTDVIGVLVGLVGAYLLRFYAGIIEVTKSYSPRDYLELLPAAVAIWLFWLQNTGCYEFRERAFNLQILKKIVRANVLSVMTLVALHFFMRRLEFSRLVYLTAILTGTIGVAGGRFLLDRTLARLRRAGRFPSANTAIVGAGALALEIAERIRNHAYLGLRVAGLVTADGTGPADSEFPVLGSLSDMRRIVRQHDIAEVIVADPGVGGKTVMHLAMECEKEMARLRVVPDVLQAQLVELAVEQIDGIPLFGLRDTPLQGWNALVKRLFDIFVSAVGLLVLSPLLLALAVAVKATSRGPALYKQRRVGLDGRRFNMYKFRSMRDGAEDEEDEPSFTRADDPRVTPLGRFMRRNNLDELPQLWNVLRGDMSLVGPRPERPHFVRQFREQVPRYMGRHRVRSGMTGWAQVHGLRQNTPIADRVKYDLYYIENWSFWLDLKILLMTLTARRNAY
ncbi:MAG: undecaprenyl-phosphate glucose phosphotransferase [Candidatus Sumerlaeaceae bacterium]|nr:undecaprenyl-phosphate glucose phosphotransferase [Candidatus Sumerlaeaceae bacterium]